MTEMPPWNSSGKNPHIEIINKLYNNLVKISHPKWREFLAAKNGLSLVRRNEFSITRSNIEIIGIYITVNTDSYIRIFDDGWRDGPWWNRFETLVDQWIAEAKEFDAEAEREAIKIKQAKIDAENELFRSYLCTISPP